MWCSTASGSLQEKKYRIHYEREARLTCPYMSRHTDMHSCPHSQNSAPELLTHTATTPSNPLNPNSDPYPDLSLKNSLEVVRTILKVLISQKGPHIVSNMYFLYASTGMHTCTHLMIMKQARPSSRSSVSYLKPFLSADSNQTGSVELGLYT